MVIYFLPNLGNWTTPGYEESTCRLWLEQEGLGAGDGGGGAGRQLHLLQALWGLSAHSAPHQHQNLSF